MTQPSRTGMDLVIRYIQDNCQEDKGEISFERHFSECELG